MYLYQPAILPDVPLVGLDAKNFHVTEDGETVDGALHVAPFVVTDRDLAYVVVIDNSDNLATSLTFIRRAAQAFIGEMGFRYPGAVVTYGDHPFLEAGPVKDSYRLDKVVRGIEPVSGSPAVERGLVFVLEDSKKFGIESRTRPKSGGPSVRRTG